MTSSKIKGGSDREALSGGDPPGGETDQSKGSPSLSHQQSPEILSKGIE